MSKRYDLIPIVTLLADVDVEYVDYSAVAVGCCRRGMDASGRYSSVVDPPTSISFASALILVVVSKRPFATFASIKYSKKQRDGVTFTKILDGI